MSVKQEFAIREVNRSNLVEFGKDPEARKYREKGLSLRGDYLWVLRR